MALRLPPEGAAYADSRVIFGDGRLDFSDRFGTFGEGEVEVYDTKDVRLSIVGRGDDSAAYVGSGLAFGLSLEPERFEALWNVATTLPNAELQVHGHLDVYRLRGSHDGVAYLNTEDRNRVGPVMVRLSERAPNPDAASSSTLPSPDLDDLAKRLRTITHLLWAIFAAIVVLAISVG